MQRFRKSGVRARNILSITARSIAVLALLTLAVVSVRAAWGMYQTFSEAVAAEGESTQQLAALKEQESGVRASVESLSTGRGLEEQVRERYGWGKPGEGKIDIVRDETSPEGGVVQEGNALVRFFRSLFVW